MSGDLAATCNCVMDRILIGVPVYNEARHVQPVLEAIGQYADDILVIDDGSTDETPMALARQGVEVIRHARNRGYGRAMQELLRRAAFDGYAWLITMDCDLQHEPAALPAFFQAIRTNDSDVISGSRYMPESGVEGDAPPERQSINRHMTRRVNDRLELGITDAFCGFKAYRTIACSHLPLDCDGYEFPLQFWVQAVAHGLRITELPIRLIYNDPKRSFGGPLDDAANRKKVYEDTFAREVDRWTHRLPSVAMCPTPC
ncbi:MAG: glycosyltransferase family 2 protein [Phycisphaerales bacterium]|nr:glycosyltransferase family 2 protein [Phycisphaerales bacterium]